MLLCSLFLIASTGFASIPTSYGTATHHDSYWQELDLVGDNPDTSLGVYWSLDGGNTWVNDVFNICVGDTIQFMISMQKDHVGNHNYDLSKTWFDLDQNGSFESDDAISFFSILVNEENPNDNRGNIQGSDRTNLTSGSVGGMYASDITDEFLITDNYLDTTLYLRSRVTCSESLSNAYYSANHNMNQQWRNNGTARYNTNQYNDMFKAMDSIYFANTGTNSLYQGEVEEHAFTVTGAPTPEPATMLLFGIGLVGFSGYMRRKKK